MPRARILAAWAVLTMYLLWANGNTDSELNNHEKIACGANKRYDSG